MKKIKIIHVVNSLCFGGIENSVVELCNHIDKTQYDVSLIVLSNNDNQIIDRVDNGINVIEIPVNHYDSSLRNIGVLFRRLNFLKSLFIDIQPDIIHTHIYQYNSIPLLCAIKLSGVKVKHFHTIHSTGLHYQYLRLHDKIKLRIESFFYKLFQSNIVCVSKEVERNVKKLLSGYSDCRIIPNGVDTTVYDIARFPSKDQNNSRLNLIYVARLVEGKNHITLLKAMQILAAKHVDVCLTLVGDGSLRNELELYMRQNHLENCISFLGNRNDVAALLSKADIGIFPSEYEGFSVAMVEMMSMHLAMICSDIQNFRDLSMNNDDMLFFDVFDYQHLAALIESLYDDRRLLLKQQQAAYAISQQYSIQKVVSKLCNYYSQNI